MDKIWYRNPSKSDVIGRCGGDEKNEWPSRTDKKSNDKKEEKKKDHLKVLGTNNNLSILPRLKSTETVNIYMKALILNWGIVIAAVPKNKCYLLFISKWFSILESLSSRANQSPEALPGWASAVWRVFVCGPYMFTTLRTERCIKKSRTKFTWVA